jgi:type II secretory pathway component GspD/PulD (secretin)
VPILSKLPLIGALFSRSTNESLNTRLVLWFVVQADDKQDKLKSIDF